MKRRTIFLVSAGLLACSWGRIALAAPAASPAFRGRWAEQLAPRFTGTRLPEPPEQHTAWEHPQDDFAGAAEKLFALGMADPRGCEYREVEIAIGGIWGSGGRKQKEHAWLIPGETDGQKFAVAWDGLVYPAWNVGDPVDLQTDVDALSAAAGDPTHKPIYANEAEGVQPGWLTLTKAALLWRLGMDAPARQIGDLMRGEGRPALMELASEWFWFETDRAISEHERGDDKLALIDADRLSRAYAQLEPELMGLAPKTHPEFMVGQMYFYFMPSVNQLLDDTRHRLAEDPAKVVEVTLEGEIADLENVNARQMSVPGGVPLVSDGRVQALIRRGDSAVEPLLDTIEHDKRLTRSVSTGGSFARSRTLIPVSMAADAALANLLKLPLDWEYYNDRVPGEREAHVARLRAYWEKFKGLPTTERWYRSLADDGAGAELWSQMAINITQPDDKGWIDAWAGVQAPARLPVRVQGRWFPGDSIENIELGGRSQLEGAVLSGKREPSVSELLARRSDEAAAMPEKPQSGSPNFRASVNLALSLARWDPIAAQPVLLRRLNALVQDRVLRANIGTRPTTLALALRRCGSEAGWQATAKWIRTNDILENAAGEQFFEALTKGLGQKDMARAIDWMFNDPAAPWYDVATSDNRPNLADLEASELVKSPIFLKQVQRGLEKQEVVGEIQRVGPEPPGRREEGLERKVGDQRFWEPLTESQKDLPRGDQAVPIRECDYYAWVVGRKDDGLKFELYWPESKRNEAVLRCKAWVRNHLMKVD